MSIHNGDEDSQEVLFHMPENASLYKVPPIEIDLGHEPPPVDLLMSPPEIEIDLLVPQPFMLLRASGMAWLDEIRRHMQDLGIGVVEEFTVNQFELFARYIYPVNLEDSNSYFWLMLSREALGDNANIAHAFVLDSTYLEDYTKVIDTKRYIRKQIGITPYKAQYQGKIIHTDLHHLHAPDVHNLRREYSLLKAFQKYFS